MARSGAHFFLIVDDIESVRATLEAQLKAIDPSNVVLSAHDVPMAKKVFNENRDKINFIISDWYMPGETGLSFLKYIRFDLNLKNLPFVVLTTSNEHKSIMEAITLGVSNYIFKPWNLKDLEEKIDAVWKRHNP